LEKQRSRSGKLQRPDQPLFEYIVKNWFSHGDSNLGVKKDVMFVPITINYDRVYEGRSFPLELLGEVKQKATFIRFLKSVRHIKMQLGRVHIRYCAPISLKDHLAEFSL
jgi:glycerol-3-phosphate O-acyltransferase